MVKRHTRGRSSARVVTLVLFVIGLPLAGFGAWFGYSSWLLLTTGKQADGKVIRMVQNPSPNSRGSFAPVVEFHGDGVRHEFQSSIYSTPSRFSVGSTVTVVYDPLNPKSASIASFVDLWLFPLIFGGIGVMIMTVAVAIVVSKWLGDAIDPDVRESSGRGPDLYEESNALL